MRRTAGLTAASGDRAGNTYYTGGVDAGNLTLNPPGSLNTVWRGCGTLEDIDTSGRK